MNEEIIDIVCAIPKDDWVLDGSSIHNRVDFKTRLKDLDIELREPHSGYNAALYVGGVQFCNKEKLNKLHSDINSLFDVIKKKRLNCQIESIHKTLTNK